MSFIGCTRKSDGKRLCVCKSRQVRIRNADTRSGRALLRFCFSFCCWCCCCCNGGGSVCGALKAPECAVPRGGCSDVTGGRARKRALPHRRTRATLTPQFPLHQKHSSHHGSRDADVGGFHAYTHTDKSDLTPPPTHAQD